MLLYRLQKFCIWYNASNDVNLGPTHGIRVNRSFICWKTKPTTLYSYDVFAKVILGQKVGLPERKGNCDQDEADIEESCVDPTTSTYKPSVSVHNVEEPGQGAQYDGFHIWGFAV